MCLRKSRIGAKAIVCSVLLLLLAFPCFSAGYLAELLGVRFPAEQSSLQSQEEQASSENQTTEMQESYLENQQELQEMSEMELLQRVQELSSASERVSTDFKEQLTVVNGSLENLKTQLENLKGVNKISDEQYDEVLSDLNRLASNNASMADENAYSKGYIAGLEERERQTKFFANAGAVIGFEDKLPTWGITGNMGMKFGRGLMIGTGINYMLGDFSHPIDLKWDLDNLSINATIGWEW